MELNLHFCVLLNTVKMCYYSLRSSLISTLVSIYFIHFLYIVDPIMKQKDLCLGPVNTAHSLYSRSKCVDYLQKYFFIKNNHRSISQIHKIVFIFEYIKIHVKCMNYIIKLKMKV